MNWTPQQQSAISVRDRSVIVSAAAGSGKTAVLVERLLRILSDTVHPVPADSIIVVTFTNDAAAQMKQRLYQKLSEKLALLENETEYEEEYLWLLRQQAALGSAKITTINAFCFDLIRENADVCGVSPQFAIAEPAQEAAYVQNALQTVLERWSRERREDMDSLFAFFCTKDDTELEKVVLEVAEYLKSLAFPDAWMEKVVERCSDSEGLFEAFRQGFCKKMEEILALAEKGRSFAENAMPVSGKDGNRFLSLLEEDLCNMRFHLNHAALAEREKLMEQPMLHKVKFTAFPRNSKGVDLENKRVFQQLRAVYTELYKGAVDSCLSPLYYFSEDMEIQQHIIPLLLALTREYRTELSEEKKRQNVLSFDDGEFLALELLGGMDSEGRLFRKPLAEALAGQYSLIMVDEYQDSNNKQDCLFKLLSKNCEISADGKHLHYGSNVFLVGDVKQSIYSFRQANPENFRSVLKDSTPLADCGEGAIARIYLNQNFRSSQGVIDFVNRLFGCLMTERCGEILYDENEQLNFGAACYLQCPDTKTKILLPKSGEDTPKDCDIQAECIADTISGMLRSKAPVTLPDGSSRPCEPQDFCILLRSLKKYSTPLLQALQKRSIPAECGEGTSFLKLPEVHFIWNYLKILDNPLTDVAMASVLTSPVYGFTPEDLLLMKTVGRSRRLYLQLCVLAEGDAENERAVLSKKCKAFLEQFETLRSRADRMPLEVYIGEIYDETDLLSLQSMYEDGEQRRAHLQIFMQYAQDYREHSDLKAQSCLSGWLRYLDSIQSRGKDLEQKQPAAGRGCVEIKTIHKSKGLEYPFVFMAHMEKKFSNQPSKDKICPDSSGLLGMQLIDRERYLKSKTAAFHYVLDKTLRKQRSEEMRLLYVGLTRARQQLFLVLDEVRTGAKAKKTDVCNLGDLLSHCPEIAPFLAANAGCMQDWVLLFLFSGSEGETLRLAMDEDESGSAQLADYIVKQDFSAEEESQPCQADRKCPADAAAAGLMRKQLAFSYCSPETDLIAKYSVTTLAHPQKDIRLRTPEFMKEDKQGNLRRLQGAARGTAVHKMLQYMDFGSAAADTEAEIQRLRKEGFLNEAEMEALPAEKIKAFLESSLFGRIAASELILREKQLFVKIGELALPEESMLARRYADTEGVLIGTMDLLFRESDGWVLVDYKTDYAHDGSELLDKYSIQLGLYQKAAELIMGEPVKEAYIYSFTLDKALAVDLLHMDYGKISVAAPD